MSAPSLAGFTPARVLPNGEPFHSEWGLLGYQIDDMAEVYVRTGRGDGGMLAVWDMGIGKTVLAIATAAYLFADGLIDQVVVCCEHNKRYDWVEEFERFSNLSALLYHGPNRDKRLITKGVPHVLVTTYETGKLGLMTRVKAPGKRGKGSAVDGPLVEKLGLRNKRTFWIFDESTKLKSRRSEVYKAFEYILGQLRKGSVHQRVLGLTGTPMDRGYEDAYNQGRVLCPSRMPTVTEYKRRFEMGTDRFRNPIFNEAYADDFAELFQGCLIRRRKTDPEVVAQFPKKVETSVKVEMSAAEREFYDVVHKTALGLMEGKRGGDTTTWTAMRMTCGHPASHLHGSNAVSQEVTRVLGEELLRSVPCAKSTELIERLRPVVKGQGAQVIVFSFFTSVIFEVVRELRAAGFSVAEYHGGQTSPQNEKSLAAFKRGEFEILFTSDKGARGLNVPEASYVYEYESALTYSNRAQRGDRAHRFTSTHELVTLVTLVLQDTVEQNIFANTIDRNEKQDILLGDEEDGSSWISAETRREMLGATRKKRRD